MKEAETVCRILSQLTRLLKLEPRSLEAHGASLKLVCQQQNIKCPILAKAIISLYVQVRSSEIVESRTDLSKSRLDHDVNMRVALVRTGMIGPLALRVCLIQKCMFSWYLAHVRACIACVRPRAIVARFFLQLYPVFIAVGWDHYKGKTHKLLTVCASKACRRLAQQCRCGCYVCCQAYRKG